MNQHQQHNPRLRDWQRRPRRRAFTLMEVMVAVAALAVLAVAIAAIFEVTGRTVTGGRRVSAINSYANLIKQQMEADFAAMTRDGFLLIRGQWADADAAPGINLANDLVPLHPDDTNPRPRRIDEVMFFAKGQFTSAREPLHPQLIARADAARIYYGHGQRGSEAFTPAWNPQTFWRPSLIDYAGTGNPDARLGRQVAGNPNRYASEWTLLRHVTLLVPRNDYVVNRVPQSSRPLLGATALFPNAPTDLRLLDSEIQIAAQPAASSIFRSLAALFPLDPRLNIATFTDPSGNTLDNPSFHAIRRTPANIRPQFSSGLVDIATCGLHEIRAIVMAANQFPAGANANFYNQFASGYSYTPTGITQLQRAQSWMLDALPANTVTGSNPITYQNVRRVRYEPVPHNMVGSMSQAGAGLTGPWQPPLEMAFRRADQAMLAQWGFLPHCTEFIVEWSFGQTFPSDPSDPNYLPQYAGELVWHGLERLPRDLSIPNQIPLAWPFGIGGAGLPAHWRQVPPTTPRHPLAPPALGMAQVRTLVHANTTGTFAPEGPLDSYFGYTDPTYTPTGNQNPQRDWPWPRFIRITLSLADPRQPSSEHTFQFIFSIPQQEH
jgi:prepilin-type N-terminal cleavage/methylation domain-containing protein